MSGLSPRLPFDCVINRLEHSRTLCGNHQWHVTNEQAVEKALTEYEKFRIIQDREVMSDFDRQMKLLLGNKE